MFIVIPVVSLLVGCDLLEMKNPTSEGSTDGPQPVARVHDNYLYPNDLTGLVPAGATFEDSASRVERYIQSWIRKQLLIDEASSKIDFDEAEIQRKILDYRYSLMGYEYQSFYINQNLTMEVTDEEIIGYYNENLVNFPLKQNVIRGRLIRIPLAAPRINNVRRWIRSDRENDIEQLRQYCLTYATLYSLEDSLWINFDELIKNTPVAEIPDKVDFLRRNKYAEFADEESLYFLKIDEFKISGETSPVEVVYDQVKNIILNRRKVELAKNLEQEVYEKAKEKNEFEIY